MTNDPTPGPKICEHCKQAIIYFVDECQVPKPCGYVSLHSHCWQELGGPAVWPDPTPGPQRATPASVERVQAQAKQAERELTDAERRAAITASLPTMEELDLIAGEPPAEWLADKGWNTPASVELPRSIVEVIYREACCKPTPELAKNEPCACVAAYVVDQIEEWAASLLANPADEAEPVSEEWLRSVGFHYDDERPFHWINDRRFPVAHGFDLCVWDDGDCTLEDPDNSIQLNQPKTRGDVRRLAAALGIKLKEDRK